MWPDTLWIGFEAYNRLLIDAEMYEITCTENGVVFRGMPVYPSRKIGLNEATFIMPSAEQEAL
jgi:hypothetical protein